MAGAITIFLGGLMFSMIMLTIGGIIIIKLKEK